MMPDLQLGDTQRFDSIVRVGPHAYDIKAGQDYEGDTWENMASLLNAEIPRNDTALDALQDEIDKMLKADPNDNSLELVRMISAYMTGLNRLRPMRPKQPSKNVSELDSVAA